MANLRRWRTRAVLVSSGVALAALLLTVGSNSASSPSPYPVRLRTGDRFLGPVESEPMLKSSNSTRGVLIQFESTPTPANRESLQALGVVFGAYVPDNAFIASVPPGIGESELSSYGVKWAGALAVADKLTEVLAVNGVTPEFCLDENGIPRFSFGLYPHVDLKDAESWLAAEYGATVIGSSKLTHEVAVGLPTDNWQEIAADERVVLVEPFWPRVPMNNSNRTNVKADIVQAAPYGLTGSGIVVGEWDEGRASTTHPDFAGRLISGDASAISWHGTHVAGTILGSGSASSGTYRGMAPSAMLLTQQWWFSAFEMETEYANAILNADMRLTTNSWGLGVGSPSVANCNALMGNYFSECAALDDAVRGDLGAPLPVIWAAGNERLTSSSYCGSLGFTFGTIMPYASAKNIITVGGINSNNSTMYSGSSWGPTDDGRVKPEIMAPACQSSSDFGVTSTTPGGGYGVACGTSMATPTVAGCVALWMQRWAVQKTGTPQPATIKAVLVESADNLGDPGPEYDWGYGRLNIQAAVDLLDQDRLVEDTIEHGETKSWTFINNGTIPTVSVTLAWDDPAAAPNAAVTLINNLNLRLIPPSGPAEYLPWSLNPANPGASASTGVNTRDNLEQVRRTSGIEVGTWTVEVTGANVPDGPQLFSLAFAPGITLTSTNQAYAVAIEKAADPQGTSGNVQLPFTVSNNGFNNDTYDITLTSTRGWTITPNPIAKFVGAHSDSSLTFNLTVPPLTPYGTVDTIIATAESQAAPPLSSADTMFVTVVSGRAVSVLAAGDSLGVIGRTVQLTARIINTGLFADSIDWTVASNLGWTVNPASGTVELVNGNYADVAFNVTINPAATPGASSAIIVHAVSQEDPAATDADTSSLLALDRPPAPVQVAPSDQTLLNTSTTTLRWTHNTYPVPPTGWDQFSYYVDIAADAAISVNVQRLGPVTDTFLVIPPLGDGTYHWRAVTYNTFSDSSLYSSVSQFTLDTQAPLAPTLDQPADSVYEADTTVTFSWQSVADAALYKWQSASDPSFASGLDSGWTASLSLDRVLEPCSTVVYWRVYARDAAGNLSAPSPTHKYSVYIVGDLNFDCVLDVIDVVQMVGVAFRGEALPVPPGRAELMCNPPTDITDVVRLIEVVFRAGSPPCGPT